MADRTSCLKLFYDSLDFLLTTQVTAQHNIRTDHNINMALRCLCGASYGTKEHLHAHATERSHSFKCQCGVLFGSEQAVEAHQRQVKHDTELPTYQMLQQSASEALVTSIPTACGICNDTSFENAGQLDFHLAVEHHGCPVCHQTFATEASRLGHQKCMMHCYCDEHNEVFGCTSDLTNHKLHYPHTSSFECLICGRGFTVERALTDHLASAAHQRNAHAAAKREQEAAAAAVIVAKREEANLHCETCDRAFYSLHGLQKHRAFSRQHNPLCKLGCPMSKDCGHVFRAPSALVSHLESGTCKGITRQKLYAVVFQHDEHAQLTDAYYRKDYPMQDNSQETITESSE